MTGRKRRLDISDLPADGQATEDEVRQVKGGASFEPDVARLDNPTTATGISTTTTSKQLIGTFEIDSSTKLDANLKTPGTTDPKL